VEIVLRLLQRLCRAQGMHVGIDPKQKRFPMKDTASRKNSPSSTERTGRHPNDARGREAEKLPENREQLGVNEDHKNAGMERGKRGTYP